MSIHRRAGLERHDMADRTSSEYASDKAWNSLLLMPATSPPTGMCSFLLNLAQIMLIAMHHHGRCGVSESAVQKRSPRSRRCPRAANRQANGGGERDHNVLRASSEFGMQRGPSAHTVAWYGDGAGVGGSASSVNVTFLSIRGFQPRPLAHPGQSQLADWNNTTTAEPSLYC